MRRLSFLIPLSLVAACGSEASAPQDCPAAETSPEPDYAPNNVWVWDGSSDAGVVEVDPSRTPYPVGPEPPKQER